jgi:hypothetical protein
MKKVFLAAAVLGLLAWCGSDNNNNPGGSDAGTDAGSDAGTDAGADAGATTTACQAYCTTLLATCTNTTGGAQNAQLDGTSQDDCVKACDGVTASSGTAIYGWPLTAPAGSPNDDLTCRTTHAGLAAAAKTANDAAGVALHCGHAGPTGRGVNGTGVASSACGAPCDVYCDLQARNCPTNFADLATCKSQCTTASFATTGAVGARSGNTFQCRIWHLGQAGTNPTTHCPHTRIVSVNANGTAGPCQ